MKTYNALIIISFISTLLSVSSCKSSYSPGNITVNIPDSFLTHKDSLNSASINWKQYFADPLLLNLIDTALQNNFDALSAFQRIEMARSNVRLSKGAMLPSVNAYTAYNQRRFGLYTMDGAGNITTPIEGEKLVPIDLPDYYLGLQTSWEVDIWGKLKSKKAAALSRYMASIEGKNYVITNLVADLTNAYYELLSLDNQLDIIRETIGLQENALELITVQKETGYANQLGVEQFEAQLLNSKSLEKQVQQEITETESTINYLLGRYPQSVKRDKAVLFSAVPVKPSVGIPSDLLKYRPDIKQAEYEVLAANADLKSARAAFLPTFNITGAYGFQAYKTSLLFTSPESIAYSILGGLTAPLINRSAIKAEFKVAKASQVEALFNYQKSVLTGYVEVYNEIANINNLSEIFDLKSREAALLNQSIETSSELFRSRRATYLEVIIAQKNALQAKLELVDVKKLQFNSTINLYKALGGGWIQ
jgi:multidrug efflux system outer membrane protein